MSKNKITTNKAQQYLEELSDQYGIGDSWLKNELENFINQQEKQGELLKLSLKLNETWRNRYEYNDSISLIQKLENKIKEKEDE